MPSPAPAHVASDDDRRKLSQMNLPHGSSHVQREHLQSSQTGMSACLLVHVLYWYMCAVYAEALHLVVVMSAVITMVYMCMCVCVDRRGCGSGAGVCWVCGGACCSRSPSCTQCRTSQSSSACC